MPYLHFFDSTGCKDNCRNLSVLWWKAISGCKWGTRSYDSGIAFDLLPPISRHLVRFPISWLYPNLIHKRVEKRTFYLDSLIAAELGRSGSSDRNMVVLVGAGFDPRSLRFLHNSNFNNTDFFELDLPDVIKQKMLMLKRFCDRRPFMGDSCSKRLQLLAVDLNKPETLLSEIKNILTSRNKLYGKSNCCRMVIVFEAVLMYVQSDNVSNVLKGLSAVLRHESKRVRNGASICFTDRFPITEQVISASLPNARDCIAVDPAVYHYLKSNGWQLTASGPPISRCRHTGVAHLL